jgi:RimJ/RimL family protein N-acetyltransferase
MSIMVNERITLSAYQAADQAACVEYLNDQDIYARTLRIPSPYTAKDFENWLEIDRQAAREHGRLAHWAIRNEHEALIGGLGLVSGQAFEAHRAEVGYWLGKPYWGHGIMTSVVKRICEVAFAEFGLAKITAHIFLDNVASARVLEKCGFQQEGILRKHYIKDGSFLDSRLFALVKD